jgi:PAP2 superfamily
MTVNRIACAMLALLACSPLGTAWADDDAQSVVDAEKPPSASTGFRTLFRDLGGDVRHLPSVDSAVVASIGGAVALGLHPLDDDVNQKLAGSGSFFKAGDIAGNTLTLMGASMGAYGLGRAFGDNKLAHVGLDLLRAQIVTEGLVQSLKYTVQRPRPDGSSGYSFPSGHAAVTFATATVLDRHHSWRVALPAYAFATYVATSRLHDNVHNLSDVAFGAALGAVVGRTVTRHGASNFALVPEATRGGMALMFVRTSHEGHADHEEHEDSIDR